MKNKFDYNQKKLALSVSICARSAEQLVSSMAGNHL